MKRCSKCGENRDDSEYSPNWRMKSGLASQCNPCRRAYMSADYRKDPRKYSERNRQWRVDNYEKHRRLNHGYRLRASYGISQEERDSLVAQQGGRCAICNRVPKRLVVDHDHTCCPGRETCGECRRGLLCDTCNARLPYVEDDDIRTACVDYLRRYARAE